MGLCTKMIRIYEVRGTVKLTQEKRCAGRGSAQGILKALTKRYRVLQYSTSGLEKVMLWCCNGASALSWYRTLPYTVQYCTVVALFYLSLKSARISIDSLFSFFPLS